MNSRRMRIAALGLLAFLLTGILSACSASSQGYRAQSLRKVHHPQNTWLQMDQLADSMNLRLVGKKNRIQMGYTDPVFEVVAGRKEALSFGKQVILPDAPIRHDNWVYISPRSAEALLQTPVHRDVQTGKLTVSSLAQAHSNSGSGLDDSSTAPKDADSGQLRMLGLPSNRSEVVSYAKRFLGVPYEFGAEDYSKSNTFDCSSFTQYVYGHFGVELPRLARDQALKGSPVSRSSLKEGDLIFFTVPGRFADDQIPGHVGMYIGDGEFIHTWGDPGVQISPLDSGYWSELILSMRRI